MSGTVAACLAECIESYARRLATSHPLLGLAQSGRLSPNAVGDYLTNARFLVQNTPRHLSLAAKRADELGLAQLSAFYRKKLREETGHEAWAASDQAHLARVFGVERSADESPHLRDLIHYLDRVIETRPAHYLSYALFAEYFTVLIGPIWVAALRDRCGIPAAALSVVTNHAELDKAHVNEELDALDQLLGAEAKAVDHLDVLHRSMRHFEAFCDALYLAHRPPASDDVVAAE